MKTSVSQTRLCGKRGAVWGRTFLLALALPMIGCGDGDAPSQPKQSAKPNILLVVWDTVRADHISLYGYDLETTPHMSQFARQARVFRDCIAAGSTTIPSHASLFSGLAAAEHRATQNRPVLSEQLETLAERLSAAGYGTYMYSENPNICAANGYGQGFDVVEHPWSPQYRDEALQIAKRKIDPSDQSHELSKKLKARQVGARSIKAAGELAQRGVEKWLSSVDSDQSVFVFLNYMEAHRPLIPPRKYREMIMTDEQVEASYRVDRSWDSTWEYAFGLKSYTPEEIELTKLTYDAALLELDDLLHELFESLRKLGRLDDTVIAVVGDHGEHLGEHHLLDHQYTVYEPVARVPLILHYPSRFDPGFDDRPVMNHDLFPTLLELAGVDRPVRLAAHSLLKPLSERSRIIEYPDVAFAPFVQVRRRNSDFDPTPWKRALRAFYDEPFKLIQASDGRHELYNLADDPGEANNLIESKPDIARRCAGRLTALIKSLKPIVSDAQVRPAAVPDKAQLERLTALGYAAGDDDDAQDPNDDNP